MLDAMHNFICEKKNDNKNINGKIIISSWGTEKICDSKNSNKTENCPSVALQGTTNFAYRYFGNEVISLDDFFEEHMTKYQTMFSTRFMKQAEYDYSIGGKYVAVPFITDIRMMYYNTNTFNQCGLNYDGKNNWDWNKFVENVKNIDKCFEQRNIDNNPFDFYGLYDEEMKFLSSILRNYGVPVITSNNECGFCKEQNMRNNTKKALEDVVKPLFNIMKKYKHQWCVIEDENFDIWLNTTVDDEEDDDYINLKKNFNIDIDKIGTIECECDDDEYKGNSDLKEKCEKNKASDRTNGITFASPPRMSDETIKNMKSEIKEALVPGNYSFLGGSGLMISKAVSEKRQNMAWEFIVHLTSDKYLEDVGNAASMISPYESLIDDKKMIDQWNTHIRQLRNSYPISYPTRTSENFYNLEMKHPIRLMFFDIFVKETDIDKAINRTCKAIEYHLQPKCKKENYNFELKDKDKECRKGKLILQLEDSPHCHDGEYDIKIEKGDDVYVECYYENYDTVYGVIVLILVFIGITISVIYISLFTAYRNAEPIRKASYLFSVIIVIGSILIYISVLLDLGYPNGTFCILKMWFMVLGFGCSLGGLVVKAFRIYSIFNNRDLKPLFISDKKLLYNFFIIMIAEVICLSIWTRIYIGDSSFSNLLKDYDLKSPIKHMNGTLIKEFEYTNKIKYCPSYNTLSTVFIIYGINCILILAGCFFSIKTWSIPQPYSETKFMGSSIFMIGFVVLVCIPTLQNQGGNQDELSLKDIQTRFLLASFAVSFTCLLATGVFCVPKIYDSYNFYKEKYYKQALEQNSNSLEYSTNNNQIKFILENNGSKNNKNNKFSINLSNGTLKRAAAVGNTLIDGSMLGNNSKHRFSMLNSELNSTSMYHKRVTRCQIINNELHCPDCGCIFEVTE